MSSLLSPIEALGLSGVALDSRVRAAMSHIGDAALGRVAARLSEDARASELLYERDGEMVPIPIMLRPLLAMDGQMAYVHHACTQMMDALKNLPALYLADDTVRRVLRIGEAEERWLRDTWTPAHERNNPVYGRLDAVCDFSAAGWEDSLKFMEANLSGVGGISYGPLAEQLMMRDIVPSLVAHDPGLEIELPRDQRDLFIQTLIDHSRAIGRPQCRLAFIECKDAEDGINEQLVLKRLFEKTYGLAISHADPAELYVRDGEVWHEDRIVDVAYRDYEARDILALEEELGRPLEAMRMLFRENRMVSSAVGDFDHKSCLEILSDPALAERFFSFDECRLFRRHVLWTRVVSDRRTTLPHGQEGDLLEHARRHREALVLKPNRSYGGDGVMLGASMSEGDWERALNEALAASEDPDLSWVLQQATRLPVAEFPVIAPSGRVAMEPFYAVMGFAPTDHGLGTMCRVSQKQVVNVAQNGGMAAVLTAREPSNLTLPRRSQSRSEGAVTALRRRVGELLTLDNVIGALEWDEETDLPSGAHGERGEQIAALETIRHSRLVDDALGDLIEEVAATCGDDPNWMREIEILRDLRAGELTLPEDLVRRFAEARSLSQGAWEEAREANDFSILAPALAETLRLARETALASVPDRDLYDTMLDEHEPGMTRARLDPALRDLGARLTPMVHEAAARSGAYSDEPDFAAEDQSGLVRMVLEAIGFDFARGTLDTATHPGTSALGFDDVRVSVRPGGQTLSQLILTTLHEGGHGLYDQGYDPADRGTLLAAAPSMGLHEANARLWENHVGRSRSFWSFMTPRLNTALGGSGLSAETLWQNVNRIRPSLIRVNADELSYHLHILLRYELETALVSGDLSVHELPGAWRERSRALLEVEPKSDLEGVLQDGHWAASMFGYFPTYTIGSLYAAQLVETYAARADLESEIGAGRFSGLLSFLRETIHRPGDRRPAEDLVMAATGKGLDAGAFLRHVTRKCGA
jgi:carboxypeptidase Taq